MTTTKRLEVAGKALLRTILTPWAKRPPVEMPDLSALRRVLLFRTDRIGDQIVSIPVYRTLARLLPQARIEVLCSPANRAVLRGNPYVRDTLVYDKRKPSAIPGLVREIRRRRYDLAIELLLKPSTTSQALMALSGSLYRCGYALSGERHLYTHAVSSDSWGREHIMHQMFRLLGVMGIPWEERDMLPELPLPQDVLSVADTYFAGLENVAGPTFGVNLSAGSPERTLPYETVFGVVMGLMGRYGTHRILLSAIGGDREVGERLVRETGERTILLPPTSDILQTAAYLRQCDLIVTPDTAMVHVAEGLGEPVVAIYTADPINLVHWRPWGIPYRMVVAEGRDLRRILVAPILTAIDEVMEEIKNGPTTTEETA